MRCKEEKIKIERNTIRKLTEISSKSSLRYAVSLLNLAAQSAKTAS